MRGTYVGVVIAALLFGVGGTGFAEETAKKKPFSQSAKVLQSAATVGKQDLQADAVVVLDETHYTVRNSMITQHSIHRIVKVQTVNGVKNWGYFGRGWAPWYQERPTMQARVIGANGKEHKFDPKSVELIPPPQGEDHTYSDWRQLRAPLPGVHAGSVVETLTVVKNSRAYAKAGDLEELIVGNWVPTMKTRIVIDSDRKLSPTFFLTKNVSKQLTKKKGRFVYTFTIGRSAPFSYEKNQPNDRVRIPTMKFSTGGSWKSMAREYAKTVDAQILAGAFPSKAMPSKGKTRRETISNALKVLHDNIRYTGLEFGLNAIVPWTPAETWKREFGDCKDKATSLVAVLRSLGIPAHVALLSSGGGADVDPKIPGMGSFNHAIVYVAPSGSEKYGIWIDATETLASPGQLSLNVQGRYALVAAKTTTKLLKIPVQSARNNRLVEERNVVLPGIGEGSITEISHFHGTRELIGRYAYRERSDKSLRADMEGYIADQYQSSDLAKTFSSDAKDLNTPLLLTLTADKAGVTYAGTHEAGIDIPRFALFEFVSPQLMVVAKEKEHLRSRINKREQPLRVFPSHKEWRYHIKHAPGFEVKTLPRDQDRKLGAVRFRQEFRVHKGYVAATLSVSIEKTKLTPAEVNGTRKALAAFLDNSVIRVRLHHDGMALWERGKAGESVAFLQKAIALPQSSRDEAAEKVRLVQVLLNLGLNADAQRIAKEASSSTKDYSVVSELLAYTLERSSFGVHLGEGANRDEALVAYQHAVAASTERKNELRGSYGQLLMVDSSGQMADENLGKASTELKAAVDAGLSDYEWDYVRTMARLGRYQELLEVAISKEDRANFAVARLVAIAHLSGKEAMLKEAGARDINHETLRWATDLLVDTGDYALAKALLLKCNPKYQKTWWAKKIAGLGQATKKSPAVQLMAGILRDVALHRELSDKQLAPQADGKSWVLLSFLGRKTQKRLPSFLRQNPVVLFDVASSTLDVIASETRGRWQKLTFGLGNARKWTVYLSKRGRALRFLGSEFGIEPLGLAIRDSLARRKMSEAIGLSEWAEQFTAGQPDWQVFSDTPLQARVAFSLKDAPQGKRLRWHAAALLHDGKQDRRTREALSECAAYGNVHCKEALVRYWMGQGEYPKALSELSAMEVLMKTQETRFGLAASQVRALRALKEYGKAMKIVVALRKGKLEEAQQDESLYLLTETLSGQGRFKDASLELQRAMDTGNANVPNNLAWQQLFVREQPDLDLALRHARDAGDDAGSLHTLATVLAAHGDNIEAMNTIVSAQKKRGKTDIIDWIVYGRVAANLGLSESAHAAYERVYSDKEAKAAVGSVSTASLALYWDKELASR